MIKKILYVCMGNICRSPMAEGILKNKIKQYDLPILVDSAGTHDYHQGSPYDQRTINLLKKRNISLDNLTSRKIVKEDLDKFDIIFVADNQNYSALAKAFGDYSLDNVYLMSAYSKNHSNQDIPDPYYGCDNGFEVVYRMLDESIDEWLKEEGLIN